MENKYKDLIEVTCVNGELKIIVNNEEVVLITQEQNSIDTSKIFNKLSICREYDFDLKIDDADIPEELEVLHKYTTMFLENLKIELGKINYEVDDSETIEE